MALYHQLSVYVTTQRLLVEVVRASHNANREYRYTIFQDLKHVLTRLLVQIYKINRTLDKSLLLDQAREMAVEAGIYLHLLAELRAISAKQYALLLDQLDSTGKQLAAWEKATCRKSSESV
ncbi:MAG: four helix bundle protein [Bacteroidaceae bacterium]|nr:four helix bundle protein [Bacteroidaceae bacterium]MBR1665435.1 four helix bundle protein [Bacteroidaceae bacterium]